MATRVVHVYRCTATTFAVALLLQLEVSAKSTGGIADSAMLPVAMASSEHPAGVGVAISTKINK